MPRVLDAAVEEFLEAIEFYEAREPGLGVRFRHLVVRAFEHIDEMPEAWPPYLAPGAPSGARHVLLKPFQESVVYVFSPDPLVVAIAHARRRPGYWARRLRSIADR